MIWKNITYKMKYIKTYEVKYLNPNKKENNKFNIGDYVKMTKFETSLGNKDVFKVKHIIKNYKYKKEVSFSDFEYKLHDLENKPLRFLVNENFLKLATPEEIEECELNMAAKKYNL